MYESHYSVLGLNGDGIDPETHDAYSCERIKAAYKISALKWHPDKNKDDEDSAIKKFQAIQTAYKILSDDETRKRYDEELSKQPPSSSTSKHIFVDVDLGFSAEDSLAIVVAGSSGTDLTQLLIVSGCSPDTLLEQASKNCELARAILFNSETLALLPLRQIFELLIIHCTQLVSEHSLPEQAHAAVAEMLSTENPTFLLKKLSNSDEHESAFRAAYCQQRKNSSIIFTYLRPFLEQLSSDTLRSLSGEFFNIALLLLSKYPETLKLSEFLFLLEKHPSQNTELRERCPKHLQKKLKSYERILSVEWNEENVPQLKSFKKDIRKLGIEAFCLLNKIAPAHTDEKLLGSAGVLYWRAKIVISSILFEPLSKKWKTLSDEEKEHLVTLALRAFNIVSISIELSTKAESRIYDNNLIFDTDDVLLILSALNLNNFLYFIQIVELDYFSPDVCQQYSRFILSFQEEGKPYFVRLVKEDDMVAWSCLKNNRALVIEMLHLDGLETLPSHLQKRFIHLCAQHEILWHSVPPSLHHFADCYKATKEFFNYIPPSRTILEAVRAGTANKADNIPTIKSDTFFRLFKDSDFFPALIFVKTEDNEVMSTLIPLAASWITQNSDTCLDERQALDKLNKRILTTGTTEQIKKLLAYFKGRNTHYLSKHLKWTSYTSFREDIWNILQRLFPIDAAWLDKHVSGATLDSLLEVECRIWKPSNITVDKSDWFIKKVSAYRELKHYLEEIKTASQKHNEEALEKLVSLLSRTGIDLHTFELLREALKDSFLWDALLVLMRDTLQFTVFRNVHKKLREQKYLPNNPEHELECRFYMLAKHTLDTQGKSIPSHGLLKIVMAHGERIQTDLERNNLTTQYRIHLNVEKVFNKLGADKNKVEIHGVDSQKIARDLHYQFERLVNQCPASNIATHEESAEYFYTLFKTAKEIDVPLLTSLCETYPHEDPNNLLQWTINYALKGNDFSQTKLNEWLENQELFDVIFPALFKSCETFITLKKLLTLSSFNKAISYLSNQKNFAQHPLTQNLLTTIQENDKIVAELSGIIGDSDTSKSILGVLTENLILQFEALVHQCPTANLTNHDKTKTFFGELSKAARQINDPRLDDLCEAYPTDSERNLLLWIINLALKNNAFAKTKLNEYLAHPEYLELILPILIQKLQISLSENQHSVALMAEIIIDKSVLEKILNGLADSLLRQFENLIKQSSIDNITHHEQAEAFFTKLSIAAKQIDNPKLAKLRDSYPVQDKNNLLLWGINCTDSNYSMLTTLITHPFVLDLLSKVRAGTHVIADVISPFPFIWHLCAHYTREGNAEEARYWIQKVEASGSEFPPVIKLLKQLLSLPTNYVHVFNSFSAEFKAIDQEEAEQRFLQTYETKCTELSKSHEILTQEKIKVGALIQKLRAHQATLSTKQETYTNKHMTHEADIYTRRIAATNALATDLERISAEYYQQDFSNKVPNPSGLHTQLSQTVHQSLAPKDSALKENLGTKQIIFNILAGLTWILLPLSIYRFATRGTVFYFHAENTTETLLNEELTPQLQTTLNVSG